MKVLVTGAFGWTAKAIIEQLHEQSYQIVAFDISKKIPEYIRNKVENICIGDVANINDVRNAMSDCDYVIHLAVAIEEEDYNTPDTPFNVNVKGTYNVLKVAKEFKIKKFILISEAPVHLSIEESNIFKALNDWKSSKDEDHLYDLTKRLQESIAKDFSETFDMNVTVLRPGHIVDGREEVDPKGRSLKEISYCRGGWVCRYDLAEACMRSLEQELRGYNAFHIIGAYQAKKHFDIEYTERLLDMKFRSTFENY